MHTSPAERQLIARETLYRLMQSLSPGEISIIAGKHAPPAAQRAAWRRLCEVLRWVDARDLGEG